jgi:hypothetical protein
MNMKLIIPLAVAIMVGGQVRAQDEHQWNVVLKVVDDAGEPVAGATASVYYDVPRNSHDLGKIVGSTDTNGLFTASHLDRTYGLRFRVEKSGYYSFDMTEDFHGVFTSEKLDRNMTVVLKKIGNQIAMYAKWVQFEPRVSKKPGGHLSFLPTPWAMT